MLKKIQQLLVQYEIEGSIKNRTTLYECEKYSVILYQVRTTLNNTFLTVRKYSNGRYALINADILFRVNQHNSNPNKYESFIERADLKKILDYAT